jgi:predicted metal-binding protein
MVTMLVCRGCCCGTTRKHPELDHGAQLARLREAAAAGGAKVIATDCLGPCDRSNVVVLRGPAADGCATVWIAQLLEDEATDLLAAFLRAPDARLDALPEPLRARCFAPGDAAALENAARHTGLDGGCQDQ